MPQSLANVLVHIVFSTENRRPLLTCGVQDDAFAYIGGIANQLGCIPLQVGGVEDHVHMLVVLSRTITIAQLVEKVKSGSSKWIKTRGVATFSWQAGYGAFSVSPSDRDAVIRYIRSQPEHHRVVSFQDEFRALMKEAGLEIDERYAWS